MKGKKDSMTKSRTKRIVLVLLAAILTATSVFGVSAAAESLEYTASASYKNSVYYKRLMNVKLTGDQITDIVNVAKSQVGYHEASYSDYSGTSNGSGNITEYGRWYGRQGYWCNVFASWCGYVAGIPTSIFPKLTGVGVSYYSTLPSVGADCFSFSSGRNLQAGDLVFCCTCSGGYGCIDHVGIVVDVNDDTIYTVEGNMSDQVLACEYPASTGYSSHLHARINYVARPCYENNVKTTPELSEATLVKTSGNGIYALFDIGVNYEQAKALAEKVGGGIAKADTKKELEFLSNLAGKGELGKYYIGGCFSEEKGTCLAATEAGICESSEKSCKTGFICEFKIDGVEPVNSAVLNGIKYEIFDTSLTYAQAQALAMSKGGKLARISEKNSKMLSILLKDSNEYFIASEGGETARVLLNNGTAVMQETKAVDEKFGTGFIVEYDEAEKCTVFYNSNGGENAPIEKVAEYGETVTVSQVVPTKKNKLFKGWSFGENSKKADVNIGDTFKVDKDITLYAVWG